MPAWGDQLEFFLKDHLAKRFSAFAAGAVATAILGSVTAMVLIVAGIAASGAVGTAIGLAILLGADVGSAIVSSVFASGSNIALWASPILAFAGYVTFNVSKEFRPHNIGRIFIGLGFTLLSLQLIRSATLPLSDGSLFHEVLMAVGQEPYLAFLIGAMLAWVFHSTMAAILLIASLLANGSLEVPAALSFILGINFGGGLPAALSTFALPAAARRLPLGNLLCRGTMAIAAIPFIGWITAFVVKLPLAPLETAVAFHTLFNIVIGTVFLPLIGIVDKIMARLVRDQQQAADRLSSLRYLEKGVFSLPPVALANAILETGRMSEVLQQMLEVAMTALRKGSTETLKMLKELDERLNAFQVGLQSYLSDLAQTELSNEEARRAQEIMLFVSNLEHAGDVICLNLNDRIKAKIKDNVKFSDEEQNSLDELCSIIVSSLTLATGVLSSRNVDSAKLLLGRKEAFRTLENRLFDEHFREGRRGSGAALRSSMRYVDLIRDLHRVNSHIVSVGYPIVDAAGMLLGSRLKTEEAS